MDDGEGGADRGAVRLRVGAQGLRADDHRERDEREVRAFGRGADRGEDQAVGDDEEQSALAGAVRLDEAESADDGEADDLPGRRCGPGERGEHGPAPDGGAGAAPDGPDQLRGEEFAQVEGEGGEQDGTERRGQPRTGHLKLSGAARRDAGAEQGDEEREAARRADQQRAGPGACGRRPGYRTRAGRVADGSRRGGRQEQAEPVLSSRVGGRSGERHGPILTRGRKGGKPRITDG